MIRDSLMDAHTSFRMLHTESSNGWGGQPIRIINESLALTEKGHYVAILGNESSAVVIRAMRVGLPVITASIGLKTPFAIWRMRSILARERFDIVNTHSSVDSWLVAIACLFLSVRPMVVRTRHISTPVKNNVFSRWLYSSGCDFVVTTGERLAESLSRDVGIERGRLRSVPTGSDPLVFHPRPDVAKETALSAGGSQVSSDRVVIGMVAKMRSWKGHKVLIDALVGLPGVHFVCVGDGPLRPEIESYARDRAIDTSFVGEQDNVVEFFHQMDIFCLPSVSSEGLPQAMTQAMLCGLPVIATDVGSVSELITHQETGLLVLPGDSEDLRYALERYLEDLDLRKRCATNGRGLALERCTLAVMANDMERIFLDLLESRSR